MPKPGSEPAQGCVYHSPSAPNWQSSARSSSISALRWRRLSSKSRGTLLAGRNRRRSPAGTSSTPRARSAATSVAAVIPPPHLDRWLRRRSDRHQVHRLTQPRGQASRGHLRCRRPSRHHHRGLDLVERTRQASDPIAVADETPPLLGAILAGRVGVYRPPTEIWRDLWPWSGIPRAEQGQDLGLVLEQPQSYVVSRARTREHKLAAIELEPETRGPGRVNERQHLGVQRRHSSSSVGGSGFAPCGSAKPPAKPSANGDAAGSLEGSETDANCKRGPFALDSSELPVCAS